MIFALLGLILPVAAAWCAFRAARLGQAAHSRLLTLALASCVGIGASSAVTFVTLMLGGRLDGGFILGDVALWTAVIVVSWRLARRNAPLEARATCAPATRTDLIVRGAFVVVLILACAVPIIEYNVAPHGQWDAWAIWNQKARFMFRAGPQWIDSMGVAWSQPSHPPLVAASVARLWAYAGEELTPVPALLSGAFALSMLMAVMGALDVRRTRAWIAGAILIAPLTFTHLAAAQTADLPLGLFFIATLVMLPMYPVAWRKGFETSASLWLAGATAALAAWTKNEGVVFFAAATALVLWSIVRHGRPRDVIWWVVGAAPFLAALVWFKLGVVPEGPDYLEGATTWSTMAARLFDVRRQTTLWETVWSLAVRWGGPGATGSLFVVVGVAVTKALWGQTGVRLGSDRGQTGVKPESDPSLTPVRPQSDPSLTPRTPSRIARGFLAVASVMLAGDRTVYLLTPYEIQWLVLTTFDRLTLQLWPIIVFAACAPTEEFLGRA